MTTKKKNQTAPKAVSQTKEPFALTVVKVEPDKNLPQDLQQELIDAFLPIYKQMQDMEADFEAIT